MGIEVHVLGKKELIDKLRNIGPQLTSAITDEMRTQMTMLADYVRIKKLSGDPLHRRTGRLSRSVSGQASAVSKTRVVGTIGSKGVPYAAVHELGGTYMVPQHERQLTMVFGRPVMPRTIVVKAHDVTFPKRAFLKPSLDENQNKILDALKQRAVKVMHGAS
jgi:phage gpG-like protein